MPLTLDATLLGAYPSPPDPLDFDLAARLDLATTMPTRHVANLMAPVLNQGNTGRCVAFASTGLKQWEERRDGHGFLPLDPQWLYVHAVAIDGLGRPYSLQRGTTVRAALQVLYAQGEPLVGHPDTARSFKIASYWAVPQTVASIKAAVFQYGPIIIATAWNEAWFRPRSGVLPQQLGDWVGGHAQLIFGWDDSVAGGAFLVRNSWGRSWGVNGNEYAPYGMFLAAMHDAWAVLDRKGD